MPSGFTSNGTDLDDIFGPYVSGTKPSPTGYEVAGVDFKDRYQPIAAGTPVDPTGFLVGGADLNTIFGAAGSSPLAVTSSRFLPLYGYTAAVPGTAGRNTNINVTGGVPPYTIAWTQIDGSTLIFINSTTTFTPNWTTSASIPTIRDATWRGTVTDSAMATAYIDIPMTLQVGGEPP